MDLENSRHLIYMLKHITRYDLLDQFIQYPEEKLFEIKGFFRDHGDYLRSIGKKADWYHIHGTENLAKLLVIMEFCDQLAGEHAIYLWVRDQENAFEVFCDLAERGIAIRGTTYQANPPTGAFKIREKNGMFYFYLDGKKITKLGD